MDEEHQKKLSQLKRQYESFDGHRSFSANKEKTWKLFWDIVSVVFGLVCGYETFMFLGGIIPVFGYFPIGVILGLVVFKLSAVIPYLLELGISWIVYRLFKTRVSNNLPF